MTAFGAIAIAIILCTDGGLLYACCYSNRYRRAQCKGFCYMNFL